MNRQDLRHPGASYNNHETAMNKMAARNLEVLAARKARQDASNRTFKRLLLGILVVGLFGAACSFLYTQQAQCEAKHGANSPICVD